MRLVRGVLLGRRARRRRQLPDPPAPGRARGGGELLLQAVALHGSPARVLRRASRRGAARVAHERSARIHPRWAPGLLDEPHVDQLGRAASLGSETRRVRMGRCVVQLLHRGRIRDRRRALREVVAGRLSPRRQGHPALSRGVLARDVDGRRARAAALCLRARLAARRRREDEQDAASTRSRRPTSSPTSGSTASATTS